MAKFLGVVALFLISAYAVAVSLAFAYGRVHQGDLYGNLMAVALVLGYIAGPIVKKLLD